MFQGTMAGTTNSDTVATDQLSSSGLFAKLPAELRNCIYELVLIKTVPYGHCQELVLIKTRPHGHCRADRRTYPEQPALTRTCKLIRNEALPLFYSKNIFIMDAMCQRHVEAARRWLKRLSKQDREHVGQVITTRVAWESYRTSVQTGRRKQDSLLDCMVLSTTAAYSGALYELRLDGLSFET